MCFGLLFHMLPPAVINRPMSKLAIKRLAVKKGTLYKFGVNNLAV